MSGKLLTGGAILAAGVAVAVAAVKYVDTWLLCLVGFAVLIAFGLFSLAQRAIFLLGKDEQLRVEGFTGAVVHNGPGMVTLNPFTYRSANLQRAVTVGATEYVKTRNTMDGSETIKRGPALLFLEAYEQQIEKNAAQSLSSTEFLIVEDKLTGKKTLIKGPQMWFPGPHDTYRKGTAVSLSLTEYVIVEDKLSGKKRTVRGPCVWFQDPYDAVGSKQTAVALQEDEYIRLKDTSSGQRWVQKGKALVFLEPTWQIEGASSRDPQAVRKAWSLKAYEYVRLVDSVTGKVNTHRGEKTVFPGPDEELLDGDVLSAIDLKVHEYVKILDQATGDIRVESGQQSGKSQVFLGPNDKVLDGGKKKAIEVDEEHAVLVRDKGTGQLRLVTEKQLFVPGPNENIEEVRQLIRLADHEAMIIKDKDGEFNFYYGSEEKRDAKPRSFFIPPYAEVVRLCWSRGRRREKRDLYIERFDCRAQFMSFEFNCRTSDNVELVLEGTFFWEVVNLPVMIKSTGDTSGDLCNHARSQFIRHVARVTLKEFMDTSHVIARQVWESDTAFYDSRGVKIHSLEVTRYQCADKSTSEILEQIIQETTNRMNRLSQAESENEVNLFRTQGQIEQEKINGELLKIQHEHSRDEAEVAGRAEASRIAAFVKGLEQAVPKAEDRVEMWKVLRKTEALGVVSQGGAQLYYTPSDVDLKIECKPAPKY